MMLSAGALARRSSGVQQRLVSPTGPIFRRFSDVLPKKKDPTGMDVGSWSWRWRLAGGVAVAVITPYCFKTLIQINWEAREFFEPWAPWLVQYVRENYGFPDEDPERREHVARMEKLYNEEVRVSVSNPASVAADWSGTLPGSFSVADLADRAAKQSGAEVGALVAQQTDACVRFEDANPEALPDVGNGVASSSIPDSWSNSGEASDGHANSMTAESAAAEGSEGRSLQHTLNFVRSMWEGDDVATAAAERAIEQAAQLSPQEVAQRSLVRDLVAVQPISPPIQQQRQQQQHAGGGSAAAMTSAAPTTSSSSGRRQGRSDDKQQQEATLRAMIAALEAERRSGDSARPIDDLNAELGRLRAHFKALRGWRFW